MRKLKNYEYRCSGCDEITNDKDQAYKPWDLQGSCEVLICGKCARLMEKNKFKIWVKDLVNYLER